MKLLVVLSTLFVCSFALAAERSGRSSTLDAGNDHVARENVARTARLLLAKGRPVEAGMAYTDLGEIMQVHGAFLDAEASYKKGLALLSHYTPPSDVRRVIAMDDLGWLYLTWGRLQDGSRLMDQARTHAARITTQDPVMIRHFDTQAAYNLVTGHYSEAHKDWDRALDVGRINFGPESPKYASILVHIAQGSSILGDYKLAEQLLRQYLAVKARGVSATPLELAVAQGELGHVCVQLHRLPEAQSWLDESTKAFSSHPEAAPLERSMVLSYRGDLSMAQHDWADAQWQYREALQIQQNVLGENKVVASSMLSLSKALQKLHLKDQAKQLAARAKAILSLRRDPALENTVDIMALRRQ